MYIRATQVVFTTACIVAALAACSGAPLPTAVTQPSSNGVTASRPHIVVSLEHPKMMEPVNITRDRNNRLIGYLASGKRVVIHPLTSLPITKHDLRNKPAPIIPYPIMSPGVGMNPNNEVGQDRNGGQVGYQMSAGAGSGVGDVYSAHQASIDVLLYPPPTGYDNQILYAPTTHGPNGNCWEVTTAYQYVGNSAGVWFYNFCDGSPGSFEGGMPFDQSFYDKYVRVFSNGNGTTEYTQEVDYGTDGQWHVLLGNYNTQQYDDIIDTPGRSSVLGDKGWSTFETHYAPGPCSAVPSLSMSGLRLHYSHNKGQDWRYADESGYKYGPFGECFAPDTGPSGTYYYTNSWNVNDYGWFSHTNPS